MAEQFIHKYVLEFGQPISFYSVGVPPPVTSELAGVPETRYKLPAYVEAGREGAVSLTQHNMSFSVAKGADASQQTTISIYNISDNVRKFLEASLGRKPLIFLRAGYETDVGELPLLFAGEVIFAVDNFDGNTRKTDLTCVSGTTAIQEAYTSKSFRQGTKLVDVFKQVIADMKLPEGTIEFPPTIINGLNNKSVSYTGSTIEFLRKFGKEHGMKVWVEDGTINAKSTDVISVSYAKVFQISADTNMIGSPTNKTNDAGQSEQSSGARQIINVKTTLNGAYSIGAKVNLKSKYHNGVYEIVSINHQGTYESSDWNSTLELKPIDGWEQG